MDATKRNFRAEFYRGATCLEKDYASSHGYGRLCAKILAKNNFIKGSGESPFPLQDDKISTKRSYFTLCNTSFFT